MAASFRWKTAVKMRWNIPAAVGFGLFAVPAQVAAADAAEVKVLTARAIATVLDALISARRQMSAKTKNHKTKNQKGETSMKSAWLLMGLISVALATSARAQVMDFNKVEIITEQL